MSTPLSTHHFARSEQGSIYGLGTEPERFRDQSLRPKTSVSGLYLGGVDASTSGVVGGLGGGVLAAVAAEPLRAGRFVRRLLKTPRHGS
jgi:phytoene dehydrogenase-like protein